MGIAINQTIRPIDRILNALETRDCKPKKTGNEGYKSLCPCHDDHNPSLSIREKTDGAVLLKCFAGCTAKEIVSVVGLEMKDLYLSANERSGNFEIVSTHDYMDENGSLLFQVCRTSGKEFPARRPDDKGGWIWKLDKTRRVLYRLPRVIEKIKAGETVWISEGEKDIDNLWAIGIPATCNPGGAGKWKDEYSQYLRGASVVILPDNDEPGREHALQVAQSLNGIAGGIKILDLPNLPEKGDVSDWLANGGSKEKLLELAEAAPKWTPRPEKENGTQETYHLTDWGNAQRLVALHKKDLRYCHPWRRWLCWDGTRWAVDATAEVFRRAKNTVKEMYNEASRAESKDEREKIAQHAMKSESEHRINAMVSLARSELGIPVLPDGLDRDPWLLNCLNGTLDLRTGLLREHRREDMITKLASGEFDQTANCPKWLDFLSLIMNGNQGLIEFLQRLAGYCFTGKVGEHKFPFLYGGGANGKTTFLRTLQGIWGDYAIKAASELLLKKPAGTHTTDVTDLKGARLVITIEIQEGRHLAESLTKELTGGDVITARRMRQDNMSFEPTHKIILAANHKPVVHETTQALWRRICLIPFNVHIDEEKRIRDYHETLLTERNGILRWAVEGCLKWQEDGLKEPPEVVAATKAYRTEMDILDDFVGDCFVIGQRCETTNKDLRAVYSKWCEQNGEKGVSDRIFSQRLLEKGFRKDRTGGKGRFWKGFGLRSDSNL